MDAIHQIGVSEMTYYRWRQGFGGLKTEQVKRLKDLELENNRMRNAVSDLTALAWRPYWLQHLCGCRNSPLNYARGVALILTALRGLGWTVLPLLSTATTFSILCPVN